jgi:hypothetical protein
MFETEQVIIQYIKPLNIGEQILQEKELPKTLTPDTKTVELRHYAELAGFTHYDQDRKFKEIRSQWGLETAEKKERQKAVLRNAMKNLGLKIVLKRPPFKPIEVDKEILDTTTYKRTTTYSFNEAVIISTKQKVTEMISQKQNKQVTEMGKSWLGKPILKTKNVTEVVQVPIEKIISEEVYLIEQEPKQYVGAIPDFALKAAGEAVQAGLTPMVWIAGTRQELKDYLRVDTTTIMKHIDPLIVGYPDRFTTDVCLLIAAWGKDLEVMDNYFSKAEQ